MQCNIKAAQHVLARIVDESFGKIRKPNANWVLAAKDSEFLTHIASQTPSRKEMQPAAFRRMPSIRRCTWQKDLRQSPTSGAASLILMEYPDSYCGVRIAVDSAIDYFVATFATRYCGTPMGVKHRLPLYKILQPQGVKSLRSCVTEHKNKVGKTDKFYLSQRIKQWATTSVPTGVRSHGLSASVQ